MTEKLIKLAGPFPNITILNQEDLNKWEINYLNLCDYKAKNWSKDPSSQYGAIIVDNLDNEISSGVNGFPRKFRDYPTRWDDREFKKRHVIHAEENAILFSERSLIGCKIFVNGLPCSSCMGKIAQKGISNVICWEPPEQFYERYSPLESFQVALETQINITIVKRG